MKKYFYLLLFIIMIAFTARAQTPPCGTLMGINMSGGEYCWENFPNISDLDYAKSKGITLIRLPISWEKFQPDLNGPLDANQVAGIKAFLDSAGTRSMKVIVDLHNYARYDTSWTEGAAWNLWSNGYVESPLTFPSATTYTFIIRAKGSVAGGVWPNMELRIDGVTKATAVVNATTFTNYTSPLALSAGVHTIAVVFTNDATIGGEDRNLYVAKVNINAPSFTEVLAAGNMPVKTTGVPLNYLGEGNLPNSKTIGTGTVPVVAYQDLWTKLAAKIKGSTGLFGYDIMNEPYNMPNGNAWPVAAQAAVNAIRSVDMNTTIYMEGTQWSSAENWVANNANLNITDAANKLVYEAHQYFDNGSGTYTQTYDQVGATPTSGTTRVQPFLTWLKQKGFKGYLGEFGVPDDDPRWLVLMENVLKAIQADGVSGTCWEYRFNNPGDPSWWHSHGALSLNPTLNNGNDEPQIAILAKYAADPCITAVGAVNNSRQTSVIVFPNPATSTLNIKGITGKTNIKLFDVFGSLVMEYSTESDTAININQLTPGVYLLVAQTNNKSELMKVVVAE
jgi:endoglucanase